MKSTVLSIVIAVVLIGGFASIAKSDPTADIVMLINLTIAEMTKEVADVNELKVPKIALDGNFAISEYAAGEGGGETIWSRRIPTGPWRVIGHGGGYADRATLVDYGVPHDIATLLVAGIANCPTNSRHIVESGKRTTVACALGSSAIH